MVLIPASFSNWLNFLCTELYNSLIPTFSLWASQIALIQPVHGHGYILIFLDRMHLLFTQVHFLFWQLGRGQYVTLLVIWNHTVVCKLFILESNTWLIELSMLNSNTWNHLTVGKQMSFHLKTKLTTNISFTNQIIYKQDLALNNNRCLIFH